MNVARLDLFDHETDLTRYTFTAQLNDESFDHEFGTKRETSWQAQDLVRMEVYSDELCEWFKIDIAGLDIKTLKQIIKILQDHVDTWDLHKS